MKVYKYIFILIALYLLQFSVFPIILPSIIQPNLMWLGIMLGIFLVPYAALLFVLLIVGMFVDALTSRQFGVYTISYIFTLGAVISTLHYSFRVYHPIVFLGLVLISTFFVTSLAAVLNFITLDSAFTDFATLGSIAINNIFISIFTTLSATVFLPLLRGQNDIYT